MTPTDNASVLRVEGLKQYFFVSGGLWSGGPDGAIKAVDDVSFDLCPGECLGLVGESGSGKTTVGRAIVRAYRPTAGRILFQDNGRTVDLAALSDRDLRGYRRRLQMVFQDPYSSLNPRMTVSDLIGEPLLVHGMRRRSERDPRVAEALKQVGLDPSHRRRYPHAFSGGQRQRIGIARALVLNPRVIVADEPVSALDVSVQAQILNLLQDLRERLNLTYLFISHDLNVVRHVCNRVAVMYAGRLVELADAGTLFTAPRHPYTVALLSASPRMDAGERGRRIVLTGEPADPASAPAGCAFHPRCRHCAPVCRETVPEWCELGSGHQVRCHRALELRSFQGERAGGESVS